MLRFKSLSLTLAGLLVALSRKADGFAVPVKLSSRSRGCLGAGEASAAPAGSSAEDRTGDFPQALIFDCDGVLADTERDGHRPAFNAAFKIKNLGGCLELMMTSCLPQLTVLGPHLSHKRTSRYQQAGTFLRGVGCQKQACLQHALCV